MIDNDSTATVAPGRLRAGWLIVAALVILFVLAGCSGGGSLTRPADVAMDAAPAGPVIEPDTETVPAPEPPAEPVVEDGEGLDGDQFAQIAEDAYISVLDDHGVYYSSRSAAVDAGYAICDFLAEGGTVIEAMGIASEYGGYDSSDSGTIVGAASGSLCLVGVR